MQRYSADNDCSVREVAIRVTSRFLRRYGHADMSDRNSANAIKRTMVEFLFSELFYSLSLGDKNSFKFDPIKAYMICWFGAIIDHDIELLQKIYLCFNAEIFRDQNDEIKEKSDVKMTEIVTFCLKEILYRYLLFVTLFSMQWKLIVYDSSHLIRFYC